MKVTEILTLLNKISNYIRYYSFQLEKKPSLELLSHLYTVATMPNFNTVEWKDPTEKKIRELTFQFLHNNLVVKTFCLYTVLQALRATLNPHKDQLKKMPAWDCEIALDEKFIEMLALIKEAFVTVEKPSIHDKLSIVYETSHSSFETFMATIRTEKLYPTLPDNELQKIANDYYIQKNLENALIEIYETNNPLSLNRGQFSAEVLEENNNSRSLNRAEFNEAALNDTKLRETYNDDTILIQCDSTFVQIQATKQKNSALIAKFESLLCAIAARLMRKTFLDPGRKVLTDILNQIYNKHAKNITEASAFADLVDEDLKDRDLTQNDLTELCEEFYHQKRREAELFLLITNIHTSFVSVDSQIGTLTEAYLGFKELLDNEKVFVDNCRKLNVCKIQEICTSHWNKSTTLSAKEIGIRMEILTDLNKFLQVENYFQFTFYQAWNSAHDISIFLHEIYRVIVSTEFSEFYRFLKELADLFKLTEPYLTAISNALKENKEESQLFLAETNSILIRPAQRLVRYKNFHEDIIEKKIGRLLAEGMVFTEYQKKEQGDLPCSPSVALSSPLSKNDTLTIANIITVLGEVLPRRAEESNAQIINEKKATRNSKPVLLIPINSPSLRSSRHIRNSVYNQSPYKAERLPSSPKVVTPLKNTINKAPLQSDEFNVQAITSILAAKDSAGSAIYETIASSAALKSMPVSDKINFLILNIKNRSDFHPTLYDVLKSLPRESKINFLCGYAREKEFKKPIADVLNKALNNSEKLQWIQTIITRKDLPNTKWRCNSLSDLPHHMQEMLQQKGDGPLTKIIDIGKIAKDYRPNCLNMFYKRYPEVQAFYDLFDKLSVSNEPQNSGTLRVNSPSSSKK